MDIQVNKGHKVMSYLCKYLTKFDTGESFELIDSHMNEDNKYLAHFRGRQMGVVEAVYDIFGWRKESSSREVIMLNTNLPDNQIHTIKRKKHLDEARPDDITYATQLENTSIDLKSLNVTR
ncbi:hypothetical protein DM01DRAFT_1347048 [Hesseltinella vesiculosa]|uniref:Uncharacterized protein n=1 Tax=Hesseltinella vesiculosa TaxID=101127 RepID=A0A1X2GDB3_9FUNG|nr:hypothetical protein DM01DRAFT_1347048 [Hesseltinella vesiculosa]